MAQLGALEQGWACFLALPTLMAMFLELMGCIAFASGLRSAAIASYLWRKSLACDFSEPRLSNGQTIKSAIYIPHGSLDVDIIVSMAVLKENINAMLCCVLTMLSALSASVNGVVYLSLRLRNLKLFSRKVKVDESPRAIESVSSYSTPGVEPPIHVLEVDEALDVNVARPVNVVDDECASPVTKLIKNFEQLIHENQLMMHQDSFVRALAVQADQPSCEPTSSGSHSMRVRLTRPGEPRQLADEDDVPQVVEVSSCGMSNCGMDSDWMRPTLYSLEGGFSRPGSAFNGDDATDSVCEHLMGVEDNSPRTLTGQFSDAEDDATFSPTEELNPSEMIKLSKAGCTEQGACLSVGGMIRSLTSAGSLTIQAVGVDRSATGHMNVVTMNALARSVFGHRVTLTSAGCIEAPKQQRERSAFGELQLEGDAGEPPEDPQDEGNYSALSAFGFITSDEHEAQKLAQERRQELLDQQAAVEWTINAVQKQTVFRGDLKKSHRITIHGGADDARPSFLLTPAV